MSWTPDEARAVMPDYDKLLVWAWLQDAHRAQLGSWLLALLAPLPYMAAWGLLSGTAQLQAAGAQMAPGGVMLMHIMAAVAAMAGTALLAGWWLGRYLCRSRLRNAREVLATGKNKPHTLSRAVRIAEVHPKDCRVTYSITCPKTGAVVLRTRQTLRALLRDARQPELALQAKRCAA